MFSLQRQLKVINVFVTFSQSVINMCCALFNLHKLRWKNKTNNSKYKYLKKIHLFIKLYNFFFFIGTATWKKQVQLYSGVTTKFHSILRQQFWGNSFEIRKVCDALRLSPAQKRCFSCWAATHYFLWQSPRLNTSVAPSHFWCPCVRVNVISVRFHAIHLCWDRPRGRRRSPPFKREEKINNLCVHDMKNLSWVESTDACIKI